MYRQVVFVAIISLFTACVSVPTSTADISGFSGYAFGAEYEFILEDMKSEGREPIEVSDKTLWYAGELEGSTFEFVYLFENGLLVSGLWVFQDTSAASFQSIENLLLRTYSSSVIRANEEGITSHQHAGPDARIVHLLVTSVPRHAVHYYFADTAV